MKLGAVLATGMMFFPLQAIAQTEQMTECRLMGALAPKMQTKMVLGDYYPKMSVYLGEEGATTVKYVVHKNGTVSDVEVIGSSGHPRLDNATVLAMQQMLYSQPASSAGPVDCSGYIRIVWSLPDNAKGVDQFPVVKPPLSDYPPEALRDHRDGAAIVAATISPSGEVHARISRSSGSDDLDAASITFVQARKFRPAEMDGAPEPSIVILLVDWELGSSKRVDKKSK